MTWTRAAVRHKRPRWYWVRQVPGGKPFVVELERTTNGTRCWEGRDWYMLPEETERWSSPIPEPEEE